MASLSDVENALVALIYAALYPNASPPSVVGCPVLIYAGWPDPATLDIDMVETAPGIPTKAHVSIYPLPIERNVTRYQPTRHENALPAATYTLAAAGQAITVGGAAPTIYTAQNLAVFVSGKAYVVQAATGQTPAQLATALATALSMGLSGVTVSGAVITLPDDARLTAVRVGVTGSTTREVRRQERHFQISVWSSSPANRAAVADTFDAILADTPWLTLANGEGGRLLYQSSREDDFSQKQAIYRRSLIYSVEYATTVTETATQIVAAQAFVVLFEFEDAAGNIISGLDFSDANNSGLQPGL